MTGKRVGTAVIGADGEFGAKGAAPAATRRGTARYQARVGATASQRLKLERRMVATTLTRSGSNLVLRGTVTKPFARKRDAKRAGSWTLIFFASPPRNSVGGTRLKLGTACIATSPGRLNDHRPV